MATLTLPLSPTVFLGAPEGAWLRDPDMPPLFVSRNRLERMKTLPVAKTPWALDSGGFTEVGKYGRWELNIVTYLVECVRRYEDEIGLMEFAAPQDWMCEDAMLRKSGLTVREHQEATLFNFLHLRYYGPSLPFIPVLQGQTASDYLRHAEMYEDAGIELAGEMRVGIGSVCRRPKDKEIAALLTELSSLGIKMHGFGVKTTGLERIAPLLESCDSMAWSKRARAGHVRMEGCTHFTERTPDCRNCRVWAVEWWRQVQALADSVCPTYEATIRDEVA